MEKEQLGQVLNELFPALEIKATAETLRVKTAAENIHGLVVTLRDDSRFRFDYLFNLYGIDYTDRFTLIYNLESTTLGHQVTIETDIADHDNPSIDTISDLYKTADYQEREIFDLMGVRFNNHQDLRRLFLDDDWGFPLRKDYKDDINFIER
jgi:NADH:ubiquinone oxidoreductase subunit C